MEPDELEEKDERQHSNSGEERWRAAALWYSGFRSDERGEERSGEAMEDDTWTEPAATSPGRYNLAFILNDRPGTIASAPWTEPLSHTNVSSMSTDARPRDVPHDRRTGHPVEDVMVSRLAPKQNRKRPRPHASSDLINRTASSPPAPAPAPPPPPPSSSLSSPLLVSAQLQIPLTASSPSPSTPLNKLDKKRGRTCKTEGCTNYIVFKGLCCRHGGGKKCSVDGCETSAKHKGLCWRHGGSVECKIVECTKRAKAKGLCWAHGGGTKCSIVDCDKVAVSNGCCWAHGGGKRCIYDGCIKPAYERMHNFCAKHYNEMQDVDYYEV